MKKRNVDNKKVVMMSAKERLDAKDKMRDIKTFLMRLSNDPKLESEHGGGRGRSGDTIEGEQDEKVNKADDVARGRGDKFTDDCGSPDDRGLDGGMRMDGMAEGEQDDRVRSTDDVKGGRGEIVVDDCGSWECSDKVSAKKYLSNLCYTELKRGDIVCLRGDDDGEQDQEHHEDCTNTPQGDDDGLAHCEGDVDGAVYSIVQCAGDENLRRKQRWSMNSVQLPRVCDVIDQNQTR